MGHAVPSTQTNRAHRSGRELRFILLTIVIAVACAASYLCLQRGETYRMLQLSTAAAASGASVTTSNRPNVLFVLFDDAGWNDLGYQSLDLQNITPRINALAESGVVLTQSYAQPTCTVSRTALLTGVLPVDSGMMHETIMMDTPIAAPLEFKLLPAYFQDAGYATYMVGKWDMGHFNHEYLPRSRGFDRFYGFYGSDIDYFSHIANRGYCVNPHCYLDLRDETDPDVASDQVYSTELFGRRARAYLSAHRVERKSSPFFMLLAPNAPHYPIAASPDFLAAHREILRPFGNHERQVFAAVMLAADAELGAVVDDLAAGGEYDDTLLVVTSDNGAMPMSCVESNCSEYANSGSNWPLRGTKTTHWEGGVRVPTFVHAPSLLGSARTSYDGLFHITDWMPTLLKGVLARSDLELPVSVKGFDHWDAMRGLTSAGPRVELLHGVDNCIDGREIKGAIRVGRWKYIIESNRSWYPLAYTQKPEIVRDAFDLAFVDGGLFDIESDPEERHDRSGDLPGLADELRSRLMSRFDDAKGRCLLCESAGAKAFDAWDARERAVGPWEADPRFMFNCTA